MQFQAIGIAWYTRENYLQLKAIMVDGHVLTDTFDDWHRSAEQARKRYIAQGVIVVRADLDPQMFPA